MEEKPELERVNDGFYQCSLCKEGFRIERNYAGPKRSEQQWRNQRERDFRDHVANMHHNIK